MLSVKGGSDMRRSILAILPLLCACEGEAEKAVRRTMLDPDAAQFRDVSRCTSDSEVWRGDVNGKNSFGAYTGFKPFFYSGYSVAYPGDSAFSGMMARCYGDLETTEATASPGKDLPSPVAATIPKAEPVPKFDEAANDEDLRAEGFDPEGSPQSDQCWADYCPCDTSDPDYGGADVTVCRYLRTGVHIDDELIAGAAGLRDARRQLRKHEEQYGAY